MITRPSNHGLEGASLSHGGPKARLAWSMTADPSSPWARLAFDQASFSKPTPTILSNDNQEVSRQLTALTFNTWGLPAWINGASPRRYARIAAELEESDSDIVLLQEVWTRRALECVPASGGWFVARTRNPPSLLGRNGLVTLSRLPILTGEFHAFDDGAFPDSLMRKGALKVTVQLKSGDLVNVWNVHLQAKGSIKIRGKQIAQLLEWVKAAEDGQVADLIGGDFNCSPASENGRDLIRAFGATVFDLSGGRPFPTFAVHSPDAKKRRTLDYMFLSPRRPLSDVWAQPRPVLSRARPRDRLSDHIGLSARIGFHRPETSPSKASLAWLQPYRLDATSIAVSTASVLDPPHRLIRAND